MSSVLERFMDGGTDKPKIGRGGLAVTVTSLRPLTIVKAVKQEASSRKEASDPSDLCDPRKKDLESVKTQPIGTNDEENELKTQAISIDEEEKETQDSENGRSQWSHGHSLAI